MAKSTSSKFVAIKGLAWVFLYGVVGKGASLAAQVALGWLLPKEDFGLWAIVLAISTATAVLRNGGTAPLLIQKGNEYDSLAPDIMKFALVFNVLAMLLLAATGPLAAEFYHAPNLVWMIAILALEIPLSTPSALFSSKLSIDRRFGTLSKIGMASGLLRQALTVFLAYHGFGAASFVIPVLFESVFNGLCFWVAVRQWPTSVPIDKKRFLDIFTQTRWIMLGALVVGLSFQGDYLVISLFEEKADLGIYFFAVQLVSSIAVIFTMSIETVMLPIFAPLSDSPERLRKMFSTAVRGVALLGFPIACAACLLIEPVVHLVWQGRWDVAVPLLKIVILSMPAWLLVSLGRSLLEARGMWRTRLAQIGLFGVGSMAAAACGASLGGILAIAIWVSVYRFCYGMLQIVCIGQNIGISTTTMVKMLVQPIILSFAAAAIAWRVTEGGYLALNLTLQPWVMASLFSVAYLLLAFVFMAKQWQATIGLIANKT